MRFPRRVFVFPDTFVQFFEPDLGMTLSQLLHHLDCGVAVYQFNWVNHGLEYMRGLRCCGRPMISNGMLAQAIRNATWNVKLLYDWAVSGYPIIACEPSCLLTIKDDYPALLRGEDRRKAETVAAVCQTFEEFLEINLTSSAHGARGAFQSGPKRIFVHGHCHQRSLVGMEPTLRLLRRIPGAEVIDLDAGCCGMAGSFGYEKEHYEISRLVGEQRLFPALRQADADTVVVAPGFSCRMQIQHFTGIRALHPAELLWSLLDTGMTKDPSEPVRGS
jgi:Fe-S oxidoreductase